MEFLLRIKVLSHHIGLTDGDVHDGMVNHLIEQGKAKSTAQAQVKRVMNGTKPHRTTKENFNGFLTKKAEENRILYDPRWIMGSDFENKHELKESIKVIKKENNISLAFLESYERYAKNESSLNDYINEIKRDYCIYRYTYEERLVCDVLKILSNDNGTAKCEIYVYDNDK
ncbi:MAG: hypothetical protein K0U54_05770, partial [Bacteroidetes bacterium]|nr:hypothetical protein [Bacteroidota bacterium]